MRLANRVALVTGAGSGIGRATSLLFASEGAKVVAADYSAEGGEQTVSDIKERGGEATFVQADVRRASDAQAMVRGAVDAYGGLNILHNNAGIFPLEGPAHEMEEEVWDRIMDTNLKGMWLGCKYAIPEGVSAEEYAEQPSPRNPIGRISRPEEQANAVLYLASDEASYVNGQALMVDGGEWAGTMAGVPR